jgi:Ca2+-dependent lipid-binding protein
MPVLKKQPSILQRLNPKKKLNQSTEAPKSNTTTGILHIKLVEGKHLPAADMNGKSDPYCILVSGDIEKKSGIIEKTLDPVWNEYMELPDNTDKKLKINVWDWDRFGASDFLGSCEIDYSHLMDESREDIWKPLVDEKGTYYTICGDCIVATL